MATGDPSPLNRPIRRQNMYIWFARWVSTSNTEEPPLHTGRSAVADRPRKKEFLGVRERGKPLVKFHEQLLTTASGLAAHP